MVWKLKNDKHQKYTVSMYFIAMVFLFSCTEVIDIETNKAQSELVVEAIIPDGDIAQVSLSYTVPLDNINIFPMEENAQVKLTDDSGNTELLKSIKPGKYESRIIRGAQGHTYSIEVKTAKNTVTANSTIPLKVMVDSVKIINSMYPGAGASSSNKAFFYEVKLYYNDPAQFENSYRVLLSVNNSPLSGVHVLNDDFNNGRNVESSIVFYNEDIQTGDSLDIEFQCIDKAVYAYFSSFDNNQQGATPANPNTNLNGAKLGYFSAHTVERKKIKIK